MNWKKAPWEKEIEDKRKSYFEVPNVKPLSVKTGALLFGGVVIIGVGIGAVIGTYIFAGVVTLAGLIAIVESNKYLKYIVVKSNRTVDIIILIASIGATISLGVTIAMSLTVAGLGYSLAYAPWLRHRANNK